MKNRAKSKAEGQEVNMINNEDNKKQPNRRSFLVDALPGAFVAVGSAKAVLDTGTRVSAGDIEVDRLDVGHKTKQLMKDKIEERKVRSTKDAALGAGIASAAGLVLINRDKTNVDSGLTRRQFMPAMMFVGAGATAMGATYSAYHAGRNFAVVSIVGEVKPEAPEDDHRQLDKLIKDSQQATEQPIRDGFNSIKAGVAILSLKGLYDLNKRDKSR